ncbi:MAG: 3-deoxy-D-manno-octulosonic acid transferase [Acidobacteriaceae bacterium]
MWFYSLALFVVLIVTAPYWLLRMVVQGKYRAGLAERLGRVPRRVTDALRGRSTVWVHAVSVGELIAVSGVVQSLQQAHPELVVVVSTTTRTGQRLARERFGAERAFYFPLDFAWMVRRYLRALRPRVLALAETELWPRLLVEAHHAAVPIVVVNGRISDRSLPRYRRLRWLWRPFWQRLTRVLAQSDEDAQRFAAIGVPVRAIAVTGNLKYDVRTAQDIEVTRRLRKALPARAKVLVAGSTVEGEEPLLLRAFAREQKKVPGLVLVLAPRHPERFATVAALLAQQKLPWVRRSAWMKAPRPLAQGSVFLLDSIGELASLYSLATVAFVGGSLVPAGGHNPLEPAQFGVPIVMGTHTENFRGVMGALMVENAISIATPENLQETLHEMLTSPHAEAMGQRAYNVFEQQAGAAERTLAVLEELLQAPGTDAAQGPQTQRTHKRTPR